MKMTIAGSVGHIGKPLTQELVLRGHQITVISSKAARQEEIEALGASSAIGSMKDVDFLTRAFTGADAVYCMVPFDDFFNPHFDMGRHGQEIAHNYAQAIRHAGVRRVVQLSSVGAHTDKGNGLLGVYYGMEGIFNLLPADIAITFMRPVGFYYNLLNFIPSIKTQDVMASNYGDNDHIPWVSPKDIATAIADELTTLNPVSRKIRYVASEELTCNEIAGILGHAIGKPGLTWKLLTDEQLLNGLVASGMNQQTAMGFVEMNASMHCGVLYNDYYQNRPSLGKVKMKDFAHEFAMAYREA